MPLMAWLLFSMAALVEVGEDAVSRQGLRGESRAGIMLGCLTVGGYGVVVKLVKWEFANLFGVSVALFACVSGCWGRFLFTPAGAPLSRPLCEQRLGLL